MPPPLQRPTRARRAVSILVCSLVALPFLAFYLIDLRIDYAQILEPCSGLGCNWMAISSTEVAVLRAWGLSTRFYALVMTGSTVFIVVVYWLLAGLLLWRQAGTRLGMAVALTLIIFPTASFADADSVAAVYPDLLVPANLLSNVGLAFLLFLIYLFPNGRFAPRWAPFPLALSLVILVYSNLSFSGPDPIDPDTASLITAGFILAIVTGLGLQVYRYLRVSSATERLQTKWVVAGLVVTYSAIPLWGLIFGGLADIPAGAPRLLASLGFSLVPVLIALPISLTIAILQYRLWDIDVIIRKSLTYSLLTAALSLVFFSCVVTMQSLFGAVVGARQTEIVAVLSTLAVAALFNPLRRRVQALINRRFYRETYDREHILRRFGVTLRDEVDLKRLQSSVLGVVDETLQPSHLSLWLRDPPSDP